jgi:DNA polymerase elongation subunit (family B)
MNAWLKTKGVDYIIYMDTDSIYVNMEKVVKRIGYWNTSTGRKECTTQEKVEALDAFCEKKIQPVLNRVFDKLAKSMNTYEQAMFMKREAIADRGVFIAKKRYMLNVHNNEGVQYSEPKIKIMGIDCVRSSTPSSCRDSIKEAVRIILQGSEEELHKHIEEFKQGFMKLPLEAIARNSSVNGMDKYSDDQNIYGMKTPIYVKGALLYNHHIKKLKIEDKYENIFDGGKVKYLLLEDVNPIHDVVISWPGGKLPPELDLDDYINYDAQFHKTFLDPIEKILETLDWTSEAVIDMDGFWE